MKKSILLIGYNFNPEPTGIGKYSGEMLSWLGEKGYDCSVITTYPYYPYWKIQKPYQGDRFWYKTEQQQLSSGKYIKVHRCPVYVPSNPTSLKGFFLILAFFFSPTLKVFRLFLGKRFDYSLRVVLRFQSDLLGG